MLDRLRLIPISVLLASDNNARWKASNLLRGTGGFDVNTCTLSELRYRGSVHGAYDIALIDLGRKFDLTDVVALRTSSPLLPLIVFCTECDEYALRRIAPVRFVDYTRVSVTVPWLAAKIDDVLAWR